jgi:outer membrane immunogenic protein
MTMSGRLVRIAALMAVLPISAAHAGDSVPSSWTGIYLGAHAGYGTSDTHWKNEGISPYSTVCSLCAITIPGETFSSDGAVAGGQVGYNYQIGAWVIGPEVSYSGTGLEDAHPISAGAFFSPSPPPSAAGYLTFSQSQGGSDLS